MTQTKPNPILRTQTTQSPPTPLEEKSQDVLEGTYAAMTDSPSARNAIAATYRGYCSELFVFCTSHRCDLGCPLDRSAAGQERCIQSFTLLVKRELTSHSKLPPWAPAKPVQSSFFTPRPAIPASRLDQRPSYRSDPNRAPRRAIRHRHPIDTRVLLPPLAHSLNRNLRGPKTLINSDGQSKHEKLRHRCTRYRNYCPHVGCK
jgi:hypothetical protein